VRGKIQLALLFAVSISALVPIAPVEAQGRRPDRLRSRPVVVFVGGYYQPFFGSYYRPFFDAYPWYPYPWYPFQTPVFPPYGPYAFNQGSSVRLQVTPREAEVYVDGYLAGTVDDFDGFFQRLQVAPGDHEIVLYLDRYRSVRQNLHLTPGGTFKIRYDMAPLAAGEPSEPRPIPATPPPQSLPPAAPATRTPAPAQRFGMLSLRVQPSDAEVLVDGEPWRGPEGPDRLMIQVSEGTHRLEVRKDGYQTFSTDVQVRVGETATLNVSLPAR